MSTETQTAEQIEEALKLFAHVGKDKALVYKFLGHMQAMADSDRIWVATGGEHRTSCAKAVMMFVEWNREALEQFAEQEAEQLV